MNLPTNWKEVELKNYFSRLTRKNDEENTNVLTISAQHGLISQQEFFNKSIASEDKSNYFLLERGDFAYNKSYSAGYPFGVVKSLEKYDKGIVSPLYICFKRTIENKCPDYFLQYFEAGSANKEICSVAQEGARNHGLLNISTEDFFKIKIVVPPLAEQQKIAKILCKQDKIISLKQKLLEQKQQQKKWLMQKLMEIPHTNADCEEKILLGGVVIDKSGWKKCRLVDIAEGFEYGMNSASKNFDGKNKYIRITDINDESYKFENKDIVSPCGKIEEKYKVKEGDILFARTGASTGKSYLYNIEDGDLYFAGFLIRVHIKDANPYLIFSQTLTSKYSNWLKIMSVRSGQPGINAEELKNLSVFLPSFPEQKIIAQVLSTADKEIALLKSSIEQEKQKKKSLAQLLLTGTVRVKT